MTDKKSKTTAAISKQFEQTGQIQRIRKLVDLMDAEKKVINQRARNLSKQEINPDILQALLADYETHLTQFENQLPKLNEAAQQEFVHLLKQSKKFLENTRRKLVRVESISRVEELIDSQPETVETFLTENIEGTRHPEQSEGSPEGHEMSLDDQQDMVIDVNEAEHDVVLPIEETLLLIEQAKDKTTRKELAIRALLSIYALEKLDDLTINRYLQTFLPIAYPEHFVINEGQFALKGTEIPRVLRGIGVPMTTDPQISVVLDCRKFDWVELDDLRMTFPHERGLWSILKSLKPIDPSDERFSVKQKIDACCEVLKELAAKRLVKTEKLPQAMSILNYAGRIATEHQDASQLARLRHYFSTKKEKDTDEEMQFKTWLKDKIKEKKASFIFPEYLIENFTRAPHYLSLENKTINDWSNFERSRINLERDEQGIIKEKQQLLYKLKELYNVETRFIASVYELKEIIISRLIDTEYALEASDRIRLETYLEHITQLLGFYEIIQHQYTIPCGQMTLKEALTHLFIRFQSDLFAQYSYMKEQLSNSVLDIQALNQKYHHFLDAHYVSNTDMNMEQRTHPRIGDFVIVFTQNITRLNLQCVGIDASIKALNEQAHLFNDAFIEQSQTAFKHIQQLAQNVNKTQAVSDAADLVNRYYQDELKKYKMNAEQAAIKTLLRLHSDPGLKKSHGDIHLNQYLKFILPKAYPKRFILHEEALMVTGDRNSRAIYDALGETLSLDNPDFNFNPRAFNPQKLDHLKDLYPNEASLWRILKTLKPIDKQFTAMDKINACIDLACEISSKEIIQTEKLKYALDVLSFASEEAQAYVPTLKKSAQEHLKRNILRLDVQGDAFVYEVFDSSYQLQTGKIPWSDLGLQEKEITVLQSIHRLPIEDANHLLSHFLPALLKITTERGHTYDKSNALQQIKRAFDSVNVSVQQDDKKQTQVESLNRWLTRELATKTEKKTSPAEHSIHIESLQSSDTQASSWLISRIWQRLVIQWNRFIYDHFKYQVTPIEKEPEPYVEPPKSIEIITDVSEYSSEFRILEALRGPIKKTPEERNKQENSVSEGSSLK